jgi:hypothetical protein
LGKLFFGFVEMVFGVLVDGFLVFGENGLGFW